jgi:hypothetical protein
VISAATGRIDRVISLTGQSIPVDGFWLGISPAGTATYGVSGELAIANNSFENSTATYFLVSNFTGAQGDDLDADDNGVLDSMPWDMVVDAINIRDAGVGDFDYGVVSVGPDGSPAPFAARTRPAANSAATFTIFRRRMGLPAGITVRPAGFPRYSSTKSRSARPAPTGSFSSCRGCPGQTCRA